MELEGNNEGVECLRLLNEIIADFDEVTNGWFTRRAISLTFAHAIQGAKFSHQNESEWKLLHFKTLMTTFCTNIKVIMYLLSFEFENLRDQVVPLSPFLF